MENSQSFDKTATENTTMALVVVDQKKKPSSKPKKSTVNLLPDVVGSEVFLEAIHSISTLPEYTAQLKEMRNIEEKARQQLGIIITPKTIVKVLESNWYKERKETITLFGGFEKLIWKFKEAREKLKKKKYRNANREGK